MAEQPRSFSDYLRQSRTGSLSQKPTARPSQIDFSTVKPAGGGSPDEPGDFLTSFVDILSRPLNAVTNTVSKGFDEVAKAPNLGAKFAAGDVAGGIGDIVGGVGNIATAGLRGFWSPDPEEKATTAELLEKGTDTFGKINNKNYVDEQDNVNPVLKGVLGFAGDVALDPTTYIPGGLLAKAASTGLKGLKTAAEGGKVASDALISSMKAKKAVTATEDVAKQADDAVDALAIDKATSLLDSIDIPVRSARAPKVADDLLADSAPKMSAKSSTELPPSVTEQLKASSKVPEAKSFLDSLSPEARELAAKATAVVPPKPAALPTKEQWLDTMATKFPKYKMATLDKNTVVSAAELRTVLSNPSTPNNVKKMVREQVDVGYDDFVQKNASKLPVEEVAAPQTILSQMEEFTTRRDSDVARVEQAVGSRLSSYLNQLGPRNFDLTVARLKDVLDAKVPLDEVTELGQLSNAERKLFQHLDIDVPGTNSARLQTASQVDLEAPAVTPASTMKAIDANAPLSEADAFLVDDIQRFLKDFTSPSSYTKAGSAPKRARELNQMDQMTFYQRLLVRETKRIDAENRAFREAGDVNKVIAGPARAARIKEAVGDQISKASKIFDAQGLPQWMGVGASERILLNTDQMITDLAETAARLGYNDVVGAAFFNEGTSAAFTNITDALVAAYRAEDGAIDTVRELLQNTLTRGGDKLTNKITEGGVYGHVPASTTGGKVPRSRRGERYVDNLDEKGELKGWYRQFPGDVLTAQLAETITTAAKTTIADTVRRNSADFLARHGEEAADLTELQLQSIGQLAESPERLAAALRSIDDIPKNVVDDAAHAGAMDASSLTAQETTRALLPEGAAGNASTATKAERISEKADKDAARLPVEKQDDKVVDAGNANQQANHASLTDMLNKMERFDPSGESVDLAAKWSMESYRNIKGSLAAKMDPLMKFFNAKHGTEHAYDLSHSAGVLQKEITSRMHTKLNALAKAYGGVVEGTETPILTQAFRDLQSGTPSPTAGVTEARAALSDAMAEIVDVSGSGSLLGNVFFRNNAGLKHLNSVMEDLNLNQTFDMHAAKRAAEKNGTTVRYEAAQQWRTWDIEDPLDFISKFHDAGLKVNTDMAVAQDFLQMAVKNNLTSTTPKPGFVRMQNTGKNTYGPYLPTNVYIDKQLFGEMHRLDEISRMSRQLDGEIGNWVHKNFDPVQNAWKYAITLPRPGHHIRNFIGDSSMTYVAEGMKSYSTSARDAFKVLALRNNYEGVDLVRSLQQYGERTLPKNGDVLSKGKLGDITADAFYVAAQRHGLLPSYHVGEDYLDDVIKPSAVTTIADKLSLRGGKIEKFAGGVSEYRDHYSRLQHFMQFLYKAQKSGGYRNLDEAMEAAAKQVKKYHPDGSMLSNNEAKYLRRLIPFYSWLRGALPAIIESTVTQPGRVLSFPKASYNLAVAMGVNPDSLADPFPEDGLFPSFLTEQATGPVALIGGNYFNISPGIAHIDVANELGPDPVRGIAGMASPLLRIPAELLSGSSWSTGAPIKDASDYIDSSIPGVNYLANVTGNSVSGSLVSLLHGQGLDPQLQVERGNKTLLDQGISASNWLTGLGVQNISKPNYTNFAEIEKRNREGETRSGF